MSHIPSQSRLKLLALFSSSLLVSGCISQPSRDADLSDNGPITSNQQEQDQQQPSIESIRYLLPEQISESIDSPYESLIDSSLVMQPPLLLEYPLQQNPVIDSSAEPLATTSEPEPPQQADLWQRLRAGYGLKDKDHPGVAADQKWYASNPAYLLRTTERGSPYLHYIMNEVEARGMPTEIALLPIVESAFLPFAYSHGRAAGIWQFIPGTGKIFGLKQNWWYDGRRDVYASTKAALDYLQKLHGIFDGDWLLALAAYNSGQGTVARAIRKNKAKNKPTDYWNLSLPKETKGYVPKLLALSNIVADPEKYQVALTPVIDEPYFEKVATGGQIDLALAAELAGLETDQLYKLNPGFNRWATDPDGPHYLLLPIENAKHFNDALAELPESERVKWVRHKIKSGESLLSIAKKYQTTVDLLQDTNKLRGHMIRAGQHLLVPTATRSLSNYTQSADARKKSIQQQPRNGHKVTHQVQSGDTLWDISRKYKVNVRELAKWNAMAPRDPLMPGQQLVIWSKQPQTLSRGNNALDLPLQKINYRVRQGDSLAKIAQKFQVTVNDLQRWNNLNTQKYIQPGQRITLYVDVTQQSGG